MYKQSFSDAALIYQQNPYATKVATLETWNKLGRLVNHGEHSIAVFGEDNRVKHLFDITQTNGKQFMERELNEIMDALEETDDTDRVSVKALERQKRQLEERLEKLLSSKKDNSLCFEKLGFDYLVCDEAHNYKNCFVATKMSNVAGVQTTAAQKSEDMLMKTQYLNEKYGCNNCLYASGTPNHTP